MTSEVYIKIRVYVVLYNLADIPAATINYLYQFADFSSRHYDWVMKPNR